MSNFFPKRLKKKEKKTIDPPQHIFFTFDKTCFIKQELLLIEFLLPNRSMPCSWSMTIGNETTTYKQAARADISHPDPTSRVDPFDRFGPFRPVWSVLPFLSRFDILKVLLTLFECFDTWESFWILLTLLSRLGPFWLFFTFWSFLNRFWAIWTRLFGPQFGHCRPFSSRYEAFESFWPVFTHVDPVWPVLSCFGRFEKFAPELTRFDCFVPFWPFWAVLTLVSRVEPFFDSLHCFDRFWAA